MTIPELPGELIQRGEEEQWLKNYVTRLCGLDNPERSVSVNGPSFRLTTPSVDFQAVSP